MAYTLEEKYDLIKQHISKFSFTDPIDIVKELMRKNFVSIHGPEHHFLDGAAFLVAYKNAGGNLDLTGALTELADRAIKMPGAMCGQWGICGSVASVGAALSVIHKTGPLSDDEFYKQHMEFASSVLSAMSKLGGPRCCKRNAFLSLTYGAKFVKEHYGSEMQTSKTVCEFSNFNQQCLKVKCPFYQKSKE